ncbi:MAG TPA: acyltransferase [Solirubrobacteraceae bacterium]|jgi:peptidoglycan/LPS O-acetylase OafA/YrhL|nr:acyltransferase [Solirubrobacteraceae bacterium]
MDDSPASSTPNARRVDWLDGLRGAAALFVVFHHMWLASWPAFPRNVGPWWVGWLLYGHLAVAVFIVVSGFSLALAPMRHGGTLNGGAGRFLRRRAWRILPPYWVALVLSTIITGFILDPNTGTGVLARGFVVHGLLIQDAVGSFAPNGAFWSIAVEWQIYFLFPLILILGRRTSLRTAVISTVTLVILAHFIATLGSPMNKVDHLSPQFLALFALGVLAVNLGHGELADRLRRPLVAIGLATLAALAAVAIAEGSVWIVDRYFWVDLIFGAAVACLMAAMYSGGAPRARAVLASRVARHIGLFSFSIYLVHGPLVGLLHQEVLVPLHLAPLATFGLLLAVGLPTILVLCYGFHLMFEAPFLHRRDLGALRDIPFFGRLSLRPTVGVPAPVPAADVVGATEATT